MRESIGTISLLNFIFIYIFIVMAIIAGTISYYRAYRVNNVIVRAIEKFEGYNKLSAEAAEMRKTRPFGRVSYVNPVCCGF